MSQVSIGQKGSVSNTLGFFFLPFPDSYHKLNSPSDVAQHSFSIIWSQDNVTCSIWEFGLSEQHVILAQSSYLRGGCCCRSLCLPSRGFGGLPGSRGGKGLPAPPAPIGPLVPPASLRLAGGLPPSSRGLEGLLCGPPGGSGLGAFFKGGLSLRGGGTGPGFGGMLKEEQGTLFETCRHDTRSQNARRAHKIYSNIIHVWYMVPVKTNPASE